MEYGNENVVKLPTIEALTVDIDLDNTSLKFDIFTENPFNQPIVTDGLMWLLNFYLNILLCGGIAMFGTLNNIVNMTIFYKLGLNDSMSAYLFGLALTDFLLSFVIVITRTFSIWNLFFYDSELDPMAILYVGFSWIVDSLFLCSGWITTCLSLERCICVMFPFKVKRIFTRNRSICCVIVIHVVTAATYLPIYLTHWLDWTNVVVETRNGSTFGRRMVVMFSENRPKVEYYVEIINVTVIPVPSMLIITGSVFWMAYSLTMSSIKRRSMTAVIKNNHGDKHDSKITYKTRRLVKVVIMLAIIFTICSIPRTYATYINIVNSEINEDGKERNFSVFIWQFANLFSALNACVNFFVYLTINVSYRAKFRRLLTF